MLSLFATHGYLTLQARILNVYPPPLEYDIQYAFITPEGQGLHLPNEDENERDLVNHANKQIQKMRNEIKSLYSRVRHTLKNLENRPLANE